MNDTPRRTPPEKFEQRLDQLRKEAQEGGVSIGATGVRPVGGPIPPMPANAQPAPGYYGLPLLKAPVWKWMIDLYFFIGGLAGMSGLIAAGALLHHDWALARAALWSATFGAIVSPILLVWDLGRPMRFLNMLRVFKFQSPMSVGSWVLSGFGAATVPGMIFTEWYWRTGAHAADLPVVHVLAILCIIGSAMTGIFLATYTGALLGVTAVPAWHLHRAILPFKFGIAGLGAAAGVLELEGFRTPALHLIGYGAAIALTFVMLSLELNKHGLADRALHHGGSGWLLRIGEALEGPLPLILRALGIVPAAALSLVLGSLLTRFGWVSAGRESTRNPAAVFEEQHAAMDVPKR